MNYTFKMMAVVLLTFGISGCAEVIIAEAVITGLNSVSKTSYSSGKRWGSFGAPPKFVKSIEDPTKLVKKKSYLENINRISKGNNNKTVVSSNTYTKSEPIKLSSNFNCDNYPNQCSNASLCSKATRVNKWETGIVFKKHVQEAKRRGLDCGVGSGNKTVVASKTYTQPKSTFSNAELDASKRLAETERQKRIELERKLAALEKKQKEQQQSKPKTVIAKKPKSEFSNKPININFKSIIKRPDDIAVIIGNANYKKQGKDIPNVNPAYADAEGIKQYFMKAKGIKEGNIIYLKDATNAQLLSIFGNEKSHKGKLFNYIKPNKSNVYIYYAGHGAPGEEGDAYLVPTDTDSQTIQFTGYQLSTLYSNLGKLPAKSVTVILEACFSGGSQSGSLISRASPIIIAPKKTAIPKNIKVIAAGSESQMASWEQDSSHSLFTKYFLKAMSGEGDSNKDGKVSDAELKEYLSDTMTYYARRYYGRDQKVQIHNGG
ncbi:caspase family protein [Alphaproteobacteria bacterium]|nr:caspase family protein [Alphaproteobacteria bacterium]